MLQFPIDAEIVARKDESPTIFSLDICFGDRHLHERFHFHPGQFNMLYFYGVGEVAVSIFSDPEEKNSIRHSIRAVGRVTRAMQQLKVGDQLGVRGPFGRGWPMEQSKGKDIVIVTGGLGCAPTISVINYILARRAQYGALRILQGVKHSEDFIFKKQYDVWREAFDTSVYVAADQAGPKWPWETGYVTDMINLLQLNPERTVVMLCGPEVMMRTAIAILCDKGVREENIFLSMERNMECGTGHCGHCQYGGWFVCKDGPVFSYPDVKALFSVAGF